MQHQQLCDGKACESISIAPNELPSVAIVRAIAEATEKADDELEPLYYAIDPDALETLLSDPSNETVVKFSYEGYFISTDGTEVCLSPNE